MNRSLFILKAVVVFLISLCANSEEIVTDLNIQDLKFISEIATSSNWNFDESSSAFKNSKGEVLKIIKFDSSEKAAQDFIENQILQLKLLFAPKETAYFGLVKMREFCKGAPPIKNKVSKNKTGKFYFVEMPATADGQYGHCEKIENPYVSHRLIIYCRKAKKLFDIHYLRPNKGEILYYKKPIADCSY